MVLFDKVISGQFVLVFVKQFEQEVDLKGEERKKTKNEHFALG